MSVSMKGLKRGGVTILSALGLVTSAHAFEPDQFYYIVNQHTGQALDVVDASTDNGANVVQWGYWQGSHQQWQVLDNGDGTYRVINRNSGQALDVAGKSVQDNANVLQWPWKGSSNQRWEIYELADEAYSVVALHSRKALQVQDALESSGANIVQGMYTGGPHQRWTFTPVAPPVPDPLELQAEDASRLSGAVRQTEHGGFQGSAYVNFEPNEPGGFIEWQLDAETAGEYVLGFRYASGADRARPAEIRINGQVETVLDFNETGGWDRWQVAGSTLALSQGQNTVRLTGIGESGGANIDSLSVTWAGAESPTDPGPDPEPTPGEMFGFATLNGGTTGGDGGREVTVSTLDEFLRYADSDEPTIIRVQGIIPLSGMVSVGSNTSVLGLGDNSGFTGGGLKINGVRNVIVRNLKLSFSRDDLIQIKESENIWIDHNELWNDRDHHKDYYDGLVDITRGSSYVTVSWNHMHDHIKGSLVGAGDSHDDSDRGRLKVTYHHNLFEKINSRIPSLRFGTGHFYNNLVVDAGFAINSRMGAEMLIEGNIFESVDLPISTDRYSREDGYVVERNNLFLNSGENEITQTGRFDAPPYSYQLDALDGLSELVIEGVGVGVID